MCKKMYFHVPATNDDISATSLFSAAPVTTNDDGVSWFGRVDRHWHEECSNYCESIDKQNSWPLSLIKERARTAPVATTRVIGPATQYCVTTCSIEKQMSIVSSLAVNGSHTANKLH